MQSFYFKCIVILPGIQNSEAKLEVKKEDLLNKQVQNSEAGFPFRGFLLSLNHLESGFEKYVRRGWGHRG